MPLIRGRVWVGDSALTTSIALELGTRACLRLSIGVMQPRRPDLDIPVRTVPIPENPGASRPVLRTSVFWGDTLLETAHTRGPGDISVDLGDGLSRPIARITDDSVRVYIPEGARVSEEGSRITFEARGLTYVVEWVEGGGSLARAMPTDWRMPWIFSLSSMLHAFFVGAAWVTPSSETPTEELLARRTGTFTELILERPEAPKKKLELPGRAGAKAAGREGKVGRKDAKLADAARSKTPRVDPNKRRHDEEVAKRSGLLGLMHDIGGAGAVGSVFSAGGIGGGINVAMGGLRGHALGDAGGAGGLGTRGTGPGGGGNALGIGGLGTRGNGTGERGYAEVDLGGHGKCRGCGSVKTTQRAILSGSLTEEEVARVIRRHLPRFKHCYERELAAHPELGGKVAVRFLIAPTGQVAEAAVHESSLGSESVERCVADVVRTLEFPKPRGGGTVLVTYPFVFAST